MDIDSEEGRWWYKHPRSQLYWEMNPKDFLKLAVDSDSVIDSANVWGPGKGKRLCELIRKGERIDPPRLVLNSTNCRILAHEGRHRAATAMFCGVKRLPVILTCARVRDFSIGRGASVDSLDAKKCLKCLRRGRMKPQKKWGSQQSMYAIHDPYSDE